MFQVGDKVYCEYYKQAGTVISTNNASNNYPIRVQFDNNFTDIYTKDGKMNTVGKPTLRIFNQSITTDQYSIISIEHLANLVTLPDGTRIYHPTSGQPFQLTTKETLI